LKIYCLVRMAERILAVCVLTLLFPEAEAFGADALQVEGDGAAVVVFEAGLGDTGSVWSAVQPRVAEHCARSVSYARSGYGFFSHAQGPRDAEHVVAELRERLSAVGLAPPYVLVGHSLGGLYMQYFARRHPAEVKGLLLVDSTHWEQLQRLHQALPGTYRALKTASYLMHGIARREFADSAAAGAQVAALPPAAGIPTIVLSSTEAALGETLQREIAAVHATRRHEFVAGSGHYIQRDQPQAVIAAARELAGCGS
jgi:pimeloyl-ACP methyl ester carboxylesterase